MSNWIPPEQFYLGLPRKYSAVSLVIPYRDKFLMVKKSYGKHRLSLVGGVSDLNESWAETAVREAKEEIGIDVEVDRLANITYQRTDKNMPGRGDSFQVTFFAKPLSDEQYNSIKVDNDEIVECVLMTKDEIFKARDEVQSLVLQRACFAFDGCLYSEVDL